MLRGLIFQVLAVCSVSADTSLIRECNDETAFHMWAYPLTTSFSIECGVHYSPVPSGSTYIWEKYVGNDRYEMFNDSMTEIFNATLRFLNFDVDQDGHYLCTSKTNGELNFMQLYWVRKLRIEPYRTNSRLDNIDSPEYQYLKINCSFDGEVVGDDITYNWVRLVQNRYFQLSSVSDRVYPDLRGNLHFTPVLAIDEALNETSMPYACFVASQKLRMGRYGRNNLLTVSAGCREKSAPVLKYKTPNWRAVINETVNLECVFSGFDPDSTTTNRWYLPNDTLVPTGTRKYQLSYNGRRLTINKVQTSDVGVYHCESENGMGVSPREPVRLLVCVLYLDPYGPY